MDRQDCKMCGNFKNCKIKQKYNDYMEFVEKNWQFENDDNFELKTIVLCKKYNWQNYPSLKNLYQYTEVETRLCTYEKLQEIINEVGYCNILTIFTNVINYELYYTLIINNKKQIIKERSDYVKTN